MGGWMDGRMDGWIEIGHCRLGFGMPCSPYIYLSIYLSINLLTIYLSIQGAQAAGAGRDAAQRVAARPLGQNRLIRAGS